MESRYWRENRRLWGDREARADAWSARRFELNAGPRPSVARAFGLSVRTLERFEVDGTAPRWYPLALIGLAYVTRHGVENLPPEVREVLDDLGKAEPGTAVNLSPASYTAR